MKIKKTYLYIVFALLYFNNIHGQEHQLNFKITDAATGSPLGNANIYLEPCSCGGVSDASGTFSITLPEDSYTVTISYVGYEEHMESVVLDRDKTLDIVLRLLEEKLSEVVVSAKKVSRRLDSPQMGVVQLEAQDLKKIPAAVGEFDVLRGMTLLAGVNNAGEVSNGVSVRGGSLDQNLILFDQAPIFNPTHLFGLFSVFTPDMISAVDLYRANIPARYGGRTSSVLDVKVKSPYVEKLKLSGGIGLVSSRLLLETPVIKDKLMLNVGVRGGFTGFLLPLFSERLKDTKANFYDSTLKLLYLPTKKDQLLFTGFYSKDFYQLDLISQIDNINSKSNQYDFKTLNGTLSWIHTFTDDANLKTSLVASDYVPKNIFPEQDNNNDIEYRARINYMSLISEYSKKVNKEWDYYGGLQANRYKISPGTLDPGSGNSIVPVTLPTETAYELSGFANLNWNPVKNLSLSGGLRFTQYLFTGPYTQATFGTESREPIATETFEKGSTVATYNGLEPRLGAALKLNKNTSLKASYARLNQYLHNIYNSTTPLPTSRWKTADPNIKPQTSDAYGLGIYKNLGEGAIELGLEGYYRTSENNLAYKPGADFFLEEFLERDVVQGKGKAYGVEFSLKKTTGKINGWFNYTWARSQLRFQGEALTERINNNDWYPSDFDRPHVVNATINFESDPYNTFSFNFTGQSGRPYTIANGVFSLDDTEIPIFLDRNNGRLRTYHRLDFSWNVHFNKNRKNKRWENFWTFTVYNLYARNNPINAYYGQRQPGDDTIVFKGSPLGTYELSVLNSPLFALTYNFTFK